MAIFTSQTVLIVLYVGVLGLGLGACVAIARSVHIFEGCVLNCFMTVTRGINNTVILRGEKTYWGDLQLCWYSISIGMIAVVAAVVWIWFYVLKSDRIDRIPSVKNESSADRNLTKRDKLMLPSFLISFVLVICTTVAAAFTSKGIVSWCNNLQTESTKKLTCADLGSQDWLLPGDGERGYRYIKLGEVLLWLLTVVLVTISVFTAVRSRQSFQKWYNSVWASEQQIRKRKFDEKFATEAGYNNPNY